MENLSLAARHLLRLLVESKKEGHDALACNRGRKEAARELEKAGLAKCHGDLDGVYFYSATDEGYGSPLTFK